MSTQTKQADPGIVTIVKKEVPSHCVVAKDLPPLPESLGESTLRILSPAREFVAAATSGHFYILALVESAWRESYYQKAVSKVTAFQWLDENHLIVYTDTKQFRVEYTDNVWRLCR